MNSRPASCLTSFLLGGRCVVLEVVVAPSATAKSGSAPTQPVRLASHVLFNSGNEIFMHCLNHRAPTTTTGAPVTNTSDMLSVLSTEQLGDLRKREFADLMRENMLASEAQLGEYKRALHLATNVNVNATATKLERMTRKWPVVNSQSVLTTLPHVNALFYSFNHLL